MRATLLSSFLFALLSATAGAQVSALRVPIDATRSTGDVRLRADEAVRVAARNIAELTRTSRQKKATYDRRLAATPFFVPMTVRLTSGGKDLATTSSTRGGSAVTLQFDSTDAGAFPAEYQALLQSIYNSAKPTMDLIFGQPSVGGSVHVANFDAQIGDRQAVAGGYFVPNNGSGQMEIRFPVYLNPEAAAVNFIHTLLLAYLGPDAYSFDPYQEGLVRAAVMRIVRTPGALPNTLDPELIEAVLANSYDVGPVYDWLNQPGLEGPRFIAPNLVNVPLPTGGSVGGPYLLKYRMAGSAWLKVLAQYPTFIAQLNQRLYAQPSIANNPTAINQAAQAAINQLAATTNATVEGLSFAEWIKRQYVLHTYTTRGEKLIVEVTPITSGLASPDFGVFLVEAHYFRTTGANNDILLTATAFPIFWEGSAILNRLFPDAQSARMDIVGAYGSVSPNLENLNAGQPYRAIVDVPAGDQLQRVYLPAGAIATASNPTPNNFFGTVIGAPTATKVRAFVGSTMVADVPLSEGAFGTRITSNLFLGNASVSIQVLNAASTVIYTRRVNKGPGGLAVDLRVGGESQVVTPLPQGLQTFGISLQPYIDYEPTTLGLLTPQTLVARYNPTRTAYDLFPEIEAFRLGHGYFLNLPSSGGISLQGRTHPGMAMSVALKPGWNQIATPKLVNVPTNRVQVIHAAEDPQTYATASGDLIGTEVFEFVPTAGTNPQTGSYVALADGIFRPNRAYYVRVLSPEGVTMLFEPAENSTSSIAPTASVNVTPAGWKVAAQLVASNGSSVGYFGESPTALFRFEREDSGIPPSMGGLQVVIQGVQPMYRDMRPLGTAQVYKVRLEGLTLGQPHTLRLQMSYGSLPYVTLSDPAGGVSKQVRPPTAYTFVAKGSTRDLNIYVPGGTK